MDVLLVSDDEQLRGAVSSGLGDDIEARLATDSRDAWEMILEATPDVLVVDLQTGSAGGYNLLKELHESGREISALLLLERPQDKWLAKQTGAQSVRVKPLDVSDLVDEITALGPNSKPS